MKKRNKKGKKSYVRSIQALKRRVSDLTTKLEIERIKRRDEELKRKALSMAAIAVLDVHDERLLRARAADTLSRMVRARK